MKTRSGIAGLIVRCSIACLSASLTLSVASAVFGQERQKIGVMDFREIVLGSKAGKAAKAKMEKLAEKLTKEMKAEEAKLLARRKDLEAATSRLTSAQRQDRVATLERDEAAFQRLLEDKTEELKDIETKSIQDLAGRIELILKAYAAEKGFSIILEAQRPGILYFNKNLDLSTEITKRFDRASK
ncbi:OmpH family outer membrane protein [Candidatus Methylomirabilis sp.]|uniref:OmpH family outer membrane protein n=1 Tax=Candidatus Methylomirabilis sp. TaxID=2032687 RepID=UPI002A678BB4|nr:OmpH family outer membrane protein [Candidatus Methylomirabilis sp.]